MVGRKRRRAPRELSSSSRQSPPTDIAEINTKSPAIFLSWRALSRHKWFIGTLARYGRPSRSRGTSSGTIKRMPFARAAGFDDSIGWTTVATSCNMIIGPNAFFARFGEICTKREEKEAGLITTLSGFYRGYQRPIHHCCVFPGRYVFCSLQPVPAVEYCLVDVDCVPPERCTLSERQHVS